jgi:hypothetical protein
MIDTIHIQPGYYGREATKVMSVAGKLGYRIAHGASPDKSRSAPIGSVEYCESWLSCRPIPKFAPRWLSPWFHRKIEVRNAHLGDEAHGDLFVKSGWRYKKYPARIYMKNERLPDGLLFMSEVVSFAQEWRYYVADGCVLATGWYDGLDEDEPAPDLNIDWPKGWCGAADFGRLTNGRIALVECHHPYACGHYSNDHAAYAMWVVEGWQWMLSQPPTQPLSTAS